MHVNKENKSTNSTSKVIFHSIITHEKVSHLTAPSKISHGFLSCINQDLLFERSMRKWACQQGKQNPRNFSSLKFHLGFIFWNHRQRGSSNEFRGHKKSKERWSSRGEKKREKERVCIGNEGVSLPFTVLVRFKTHTHTHTQTHTKHTVIFFNILKYVI